MGCGKGRWDNRFIIFWHVIEQKLNFILITVKKISGIPKSQHQQFWPSFLYGESFFGNFLFIEHVIFNKNKKIWDLVIFIFHFN